MAACQATGTCAIANVREPAIIGPAEVTRDSQERGVKASTPRDLIEPPTESELDGPTTSGWLLKRSRLAHRWRKQWFHIQNSDLYYGDTAEVGMHTVSSVT